GLIHIGYDTPGGGRASSPSSSTRPNAGSSSITSACSRRHQYLCSHFTTDSRLEERSPYLAHRIGAIVVTGKSQNPVIASIGPSKASSCRCASASAPSKSITPSRSSRRLISPWKRQSYRCSSQCSTRRFTSSRPSTNTLRGIRRPPSDRFPRGPPPAVALGVSGKATSKRPAARSGGLRSDGDAVTVRMKLIGNFPIGSVAAQGRTAHPPPHSGDPVHPPHPPPERPCEEHPFPASCSPRPARSSSPSPSPSPPVPPPCPPTSPSPPTGGRATRPSTP